MCVFAKVFVVVFKSTKTVANSNPNDNPYIARSETDYFFEWLRVAGTSTPDSGEGCALKVLKRLCSEMSASAKHSQQLNTESCVVEGNNHGEA